MALYFAIAVVASALMAAGLLMMKSRAASLPEARGRDVVRAVIAWLRDPVWIGGLGVQIAGFALYLLAVANAPISMIAVMMQGGIALFVVLSVVVMRERASRREWIGIAVIGAAVVMLSISLDAGAATGRLDISSLVFLSVYGLVIGVAPMFRRRSSDRVITGAVAAGVLFGFGGIYAKAMADFFIAQPDAPLALRVAANPFVYLMAGANIAGIVMQQNAFRAGRGIIVMPIASALSNLVPIAGGMLAFGEHLPSEPLAAALRGAAFILTVLAGAILATGNHSQEPAPARSAPRTSSRSL
ncbi:MAG: hypothetical protein ACREQF_04485 [Candidatus Binataceae bacterium]